MTDRRVRIPDLEEEKKSFSPLSRYVSNHSDGVWRRVGRTVRMLGKTKVGRGLLVLNGRMAGNFIVGTGLFNVKKSDNIHDATSNWLKVLSAVGCEYEIGEVTDDFVEVRILKCLAGLTTKNGRRVCQAGMEADRTVVRKLGGKLEIGETIATGAPKCILRVVKKEASTPVR